MINKDRTFFRYISRDLVYIISPPTSQLHTTSIKVLIKYVGIIVIYKIIVPHNYLLITLDGKILRGLFEHERLKPANIRKVREMFKILHNWNKLWMWDLKFRNIYSISSYRSKRRSQILILTIQIFMFITLQSLVPLTKLGMAF